MNSVVSKVLKLKWCGFAILLFTFSSTVNTALYFLQRVRVRVRVFLNGKLFPQRSTLHYIFYKRFKAEQGKEEFNLKRDHLLEA